MKKIIDGKLYDTETAEQLCDISQSYTSTRDMHYERTELYRSPKGQFFIAGEGGALSRWAQPLGENGRGPGGGLQLVDDAAARRLFEQHGKPSDYVKFFGEPEEG